MIEIVCSKLWNNSACI